MNLAGYIQEIESYESTYQPWMSRGKKIIDRYEDERSQNDKKNKFNILWSNVQTLSPALYDREPSPNIERRNREDNDLGLKVSEVLERSVNYFIKTEHFNEVMRQAVLDRLLPGRGTAWVRYVPVIEGEELYSEDVVVDYVDWCDFGHNVARIWAEVDMVWRKAYLSRGELIKRFPGIGEQIPLDAKKLGEKTDTGESGKKATIYEIWNKKDKKVVWVHKQFPQILDEKDDPLGLKEFFPCPRPIYATLTNRKLIPTPDYVEYQDQASEIDTLTTRIGLLTSALKVAGVYDGSAEGVQKILTDNAENKLYPVDSWAMFAQNGGLKGVIDFLPIEQIAAVLTGLYAARDKIKQDIYEITGISDIIRGSSNPNETLGAQELKGKYAGLRLGAMQRDVARFARDLVEITVEIMAEHFDMETIKQISGVKLLTNAEKAQIQMAMQQYQQMAAMAQQAQQPAPPPPVDKKTMQLMNQPSWEDIEAIIRKDIPRCFIIDIETDSTIKADQDAEKAARTEFLGAVGSFLQQAATVQDPSLKPVLMEMLMFGIRGFKEGREMETVFKNAIEDIKEQGEQPKEDPNAAIAQMETKKLQLEEQKIMVDVEAKKAEYQLKAKELELKGREIDTKVGLEAERISADERKARRDAKAKAPESVALMDDDLNEEMAPLTAIINSIAMALQQQSQSLNDSLQQIAMMNAQSNQAVIEAITKPKVTTIIQDPKTKKMVGSIQRTEA
jgi:hypothetical protein